MNGLRVWADRLRERWEAFEAFAIDVVYDRRHDGAAETLAAILLALSQLFAGIVGLRGYLYRKRVFRDEHLGVLVIVVGNLTVGGTGKTPVVEKFARSLLDRGRRVAILSRGYKSRKEPLVSQWWRWLTHRDPPPPKVVSDGKEVRLGPEEAGDEPYMLACNLPGAIVLVDKNRVKAGHYAVEHFGADILILDDGFQYLALKEHLHLLLIDKSNPFGNEHLLPRGILREPVRHLRRASYVFITKSDGLRDDSLEATIRRHHPEVDVIECTHDPKHLAPVGGGHGDDRRPLTDLDGLAVAAFSGIAAPESFEGFLRRQGADLRYVRRFFDHHWFRPRELDRFFEEAREAGAAMVVCTEKDAVRIEEGFSPPLPFFFLRVEVEILRGVPDFDAAVSRICFPKQRMKATRSPFLPNRKRTGSDAAAD